LTGCAGAEAVEGDGVDAGTCLRGHVDEVGAALPAQLIDHRRLSELLDQQVQVDPGHVGAQHAGRVRAGDERVDGRVAAPVLLGDLVGDLDGAGDRTERPLADVDPGEDVVREPLPRVVVSQTRLRRGEPSATLSPPSTATRATSRSSSRCTIPTWSW
jgi:hypothetical protein